ncbi:hypothetical protein [Niabella soli]|uniref:Uncharacterized protein n=1 Tax=Niabella soli DSM 19437 TaxID=929713 RepID=W0F292_9BACT|nr:hypothetical protein [Niabella soli]AHF17155.1 hypothetical protein NIASO_02665 [Niabella soli DSM 19437]
MFSRDYLLAKVSLFFEAIAKAKKALGDKQYEVLSAILNENLDEPAITAYINGDDRQLPDEAYQYLLFQAELLFLQLQFLKATGAAFEMTQERYLHYSLKLLKADARNFNFALHQKILLVQQNAF